MTKPSTKSIEINEKNWRRVLGVVEKHLKKAALHSPVFQINEEDYKELKKMARHSKFLSTS